MSDVVAATADYERWLGGQLPLVAADIEHKHVELATSPLRFLRGTYYWWLLRMGELLPELMRRAPVPLIGDLHVENFGTWRDAAGEHRWGINDLDELARGSYAIDLVRLATSALMTPGIDLPTEVVAEHVLHHWLTAEPGPALRLDSPDARHLDHLTPPSKPGIEFFTALTADPPADPQQIATGARAALTATAPGGWQPTWHTRQAGTGSLGHPRVVGVGTAGDDWAAREAKLLGPPTVDWLAGRAHLPVYDPALFDEVMAAEKGPDPSVRVDGWLIRRLAPDVVRIDISRLGDHDVERVLGAMGTAVVEIHGVDPAALATARADAAALDHHWLHHAVDVMVGDTRAAHKAWKAAQS